MALASEARQVLYLIIYNRNKRNLRIRMKKKIQFSLVYRDMWQSSGKFQPRKDQLAKIAPVIIEMGCFSRVETNGGAFEQVNLLAGENPNDAVRAFCKPFNEVGIKTHMLDRGCPLAGRGSSVSQREYRWLKRSSVAFTRMTLPLLSDTALKLSAG